VSKTKKYSKIKSLHENLKNLSIVENFEYIEAKKVEIEGTLLHSEFIPGRKNVFIQNFGENSPLDDVNNNNDDDDNDDGILDECQSQDKKNLIKTNKNILVKNRYNLSVEEVALSHYIKVEMFTNGKHAETLSLSTIYGILFWDIIFEKNISNVFVDRFQQVPLDLQTDDFYLNRKFSIESKLEQMKNSPIDFICDLVSQCWNENYGIECYLIKWDLFESLDEFLTLIRCFTSNQLTSLCKYMSENYRYRRSGGPDLIVWSSRTNRLKFVEVKGPGDRLSNKQIIWLDFLIRNSIDCEVCYVKDKNCKLLLANK
jgi:hypothetical protein